MKKLPVLLCLVLLFSLISFVNTSAAESPKMEKLLFKADEIIDQEKLYERAKKGISDDRKRENQGRSSLIGTSSTKEIKTFSTSQLLKRIKQSDGTIEEYFAETTFTDIEGSDFQITSGFGEQYNDSWDLSGGVRAYSTIYYNRPYQSGNYYIEITHATGGWTLFDSSLRVNNRNVTIGANGPTAWGGTAAVVDYSRKYTNVNSSWSANAYSTWKPVLDNGRTTSGIHSWSDITGQGSTWRFNHYNNR